MTIRIYPSLLEGDPIETHEWAGTLAGFFSAKGIDFAGHEHQPITVSVNGNPLPVEQWTTLELGSRDDVEIRILPHGGVLSGIGNILGKIFGAVFGWLMPNRGGGSDYNSTKQGRQLNASEARANQVRMGDAVPEIAGRMRRYPDYLTPPRRYFTNKREQWVEFMACVGVGKYQINDTEVKVGDTPFSELGDDAEYAIYPPGTDLSGVEAHNHWHTVEEVGGTSSGTAGLELSTELANRTNTDPATYAFSGAVVSRTDSEFPAGWGSGTIVGVNLPLEYVVTLRTPPPPALPINRITGSFKHCIPFVLIPVQPISMNGTEYLVHDADVDANGDGWIELYTTGTPGTEGSPAIPPEPVAGLPVGVGVYAFSVASGYRVSAMSEAQITVDRLGDDDSPSPGWTGFPDGAWEAQISYLRGTVYGEWTNAFVGCPGNETTSTLEIDVFFPGGLCYLDNDGDVLARSVGIEIQYWDAANPTVRPTISRTYNEATLDQIGFTERVTIATMNPIVRVRRIGAESTSTQVQDKVHWYGFKTKLRTRAAYPNWTTMLTRLRSGGKLAAQSENQINVVPTRILPTLLPSGVFGPEQPTRDISAFFRYIAHSIGYVDSDIDMEELARLHAVWTARGDVFDHIFGGTTAQAAMNTVLNAGFAELSVSDGLLRAVRDEPRTQFEQSYSPQNMKGPLRRAFTGRKHDDFDGVEVEYIDAATWTTQTIRCLLPGDQGIKMEKVKAEGITDKTRAWRLGMRRRRIQKHRIWEYAFSTELDALNSEYMSYVPLLDDIPGYGQSALLIGVTAHPGGALLSVSEPLRWESGASHVVGYRRPDGALAGPWPAARGPDEFSVIAPIPQPWPAITLKHELPHVYFGKAEDWCFPALITDIKPNGTESASVSAVNYDARIYADDDSQPLR